MSRYRLLFTLSRYWPAVGGSELHTRAMAQHLNTYADVSVLCHNCDHTRSNEEACAESWDHACIDQGVHLHQVAPLGVRRRILRSLAPMHARSRLVRPLYDQIFSPVSQGAVERLSADRDLIHAVYNGMTTMAEASLAIARKRDIPLLFTPLAHTHAPEGQGWSSRRFLRLYRKADALIAMTPYERDWLIARGAHPSRTFVCPVGPLLSDQANPEAFRLAHRIGQGPMVLFLGRHVDTKGYRQLASAAADIWRRHPQARLVFIGPQTPESAAFFRRLHDPRLIVIDRISEQDKCSALAACDLLCVPSTQESLGVIYLEAWHYAKPVIAADIEVMRTLISNGEDGLLVQPETQAVGKAVSHLLDDPERSAAMGKAGQQRTRQQYSWPRLAANLASIHADTLGSPAPLQVCHS